MYNWFTLLYSKHNIVNQLYSNKNYINYISYTPIKINFKKEKHFKELYIMKTFSITLKVFKHDLVYKTFFSKFGELRVNI